MYIYYIILLYVVIGGVLCQNSQKKTKYYIDFTFLALLIVSSLRGYLVGGDLINYIPKFHEVAKSSWSELFESYDKYGFIFKFIIKCSSVISDDPTWYLFVFSLINLSIPIYFIKRYSKIPWLSIFLYISLTYYTNTFNSIRSSMALAFGMLGVMHIFKGNNFKALIWFIVAFEVHKTILPIFLIFYLKKICPTFWKLAIPIVISIIIANVLGLAGFMNVLSIYNEINNYGGANDLEMGGKGYSLLIFDIVLTFGCYFFAKKNMTRMESILIMVLCLATCLQAAAPLYSLVTRIAYFFTVYTVVLVPDVIFRRFDIMNRKIVIGALMTLSLIYFKIFIMTPTQQFSVKSNSQMTIPYYFFWENRPRL